MCDLSYEETTKVWTQTWRRARKEHRCEGCQRAIKPGSRYCITFSVFDGYASSEKSCRPCTALAERFGKEHHLTPFASTLLEHLDECVSEEGSKAAHWARAAARLRRRIALSREAVAS